jgi:lysophospholipase L1-like esterase
MPRIRVVLTSIWFVASRVLAAPAAEQEWSWHDVAADQVEGRGWNDTKNPFDRLPAKAEGLVRPPIWDLSHFTSGENVRFRTSTRRIAVRWTLTSDRLAMSHMPATAVSGVDLYARRDVGWHFLAVARPAETPTNELQLIEGLTGEPAEYRIYLPLYNGVKSVAIGVPPEAKFEILSPDKSQRPVVVYGTSITHGGCASRPGMTYTAILGRRLNVPVINLGFSGNGKAEPEVAELLGELDPAAFVLDPLPNLFAEDVRDRMPKFIEILRRHRPQTPILLVESIVYPDTSFVKKRADRVAESNRYLHEAYEAARAKGDQRISIVPACDFSAGSGDATVDGVHPTDLGFTMMADAIEPFLRDALKSPPSH